MATDIAPAVTTDGGWTWTRAGFLAPAEAVWSGGPLCFLRGGMWTFRRGNRGEIMPTWQQDLIVNWNGLRDSVVISAASYGWELVTGYAPDSLNLWVLRSPIGTGSRVERSTDGGMTWTVDTFTESLSSLLVDRFGHVLALGQGRLFGFTDPLVVSEQSETLPTQSVVSGVFPNPFNPVTTIEYRISASGHALLQVFDQLGRETATLVDDVRPAGAYRVVFDASHLATGVYYCRLTTAHTTHTQKMMLAR